MDVIYEDLVEALTDYGKSLDLLLSISLNKQM
jgi:hypothetical protein